MRKTDKSLTVCKIFEKINEKYNESKVPVESKSSFLSINVKKDFYVLQKISKLDMW